MRTRRQCLLLMGFGGMVAAAPALAQPRIRVVATFSVLADLVKNVGGDRVEVAALVGPNGDAHVYSPTPADARTLSGASVVFVNGLGLEGWMTRLFSASGSKAPIIVASNGVEPRTTTDQHERGHMIPDPHAWQSIANVRIYVANIRDGLSRVDPAGADFYDAHAAAYLAKLEALEREVQAAIDRIPADHRKIITTHDAFGYFGDAYGLQIISPEGLSTDTEPSAKDVARIISQIKAQKIPAVFLENVADPRLMQQIGREAGARVGGPLWTDALSEPNGPAASYIDMMHHNVRELERALLHRAPPFDGNSEPVNG